MPFPREYFRRQDESDDSIFYVPPRKVVHIDDTAIEAVTTLLGELLPPGGIYLDLMSSWRSHLPDELKPARVVGLGMNAAEMMDNPQLNKHVVHNLNVDSTLPFEDDVFDGAFCTVSVQYLIHPVEVFDEVNRVLKPGAPFIVSFSNRCFPNKAVAVWLSTTDQQHVALVTQYFEESGNWRGIAAVSKLPPKSGAHDPLFAVYGMKL